MVDWDAARYHRISEPQVEWGRVVVTRLAPAPGESILDVGCGTGRLTAEMAALSGVKVVGLDRSGPMLAEAAAQHHARFACVRGDAAALPFNDAFDAIFSNATLHWVPDHDALFRSLHAALRPGGRLVAQFGGAGNLRRLYGRARALMQRAPFAAFYADWRDPWRFEEEEPTRKRLAEAGFARADVWLQAIDARFDDPARFSEFIGSVCLRHELDRLPPGLRGGFIGALTTEAAGDSPAYALDYRRLNVTAWKGAA